MGYITKGIITPQPIEMPSGIHWLRQFIDRNDRRMLGEYPKGFIRESLPWDFYPFVVNHGEVRAPLVFISQVGGRLARTPVLPQGTRMLQAYHEHEGNVRHLHTLSRDARLALLRAVDAQHPYVRSYDRWGEEMESEEAGSAWEVTEAVRDMERAAIGVRHLADLLEITARAWEEAGDARRGARYVLLGMEPRPPPGGGARW